MRVCGSSDDALGLDGAVHHPLPRATGGRDLCGSGDWRVRPTLRPRRLSLGPLCRRGGAVGRTDPKQVPRHRHAAGQPNGGARRPGWWVAVV